ncbi:MAG TPA: hypothetical protein VK726_02495 [Acetobacteraceae bacterium]|jgi:hypothetical protein|nr:hypothetical protein [Acetobacteraceae bacterium]
MKFAAAVARTKRARSGGILFILPCHQRIHPREIRMRMRQRIRHEPLVVLVGQRVQHAHDGAGRLNGTTGSHRTTRSRFQRGVGSAAITGASNRGTGHTANGECMLGANRERLSSRFRCETQASTAKMSGTR